MNKHTPGPWKANGSTVISESNKGLTVNGSYDEQSKRYYGGYLIAESVAPANADTIAAAPSMYKALKNTCGQICHEADEEACEHCCVRLALDQAEGK